MNSVRAAELMKLSGSILMEIMPPETGWTKLQKRSAIWEDEPFGKFFITDFGSINYETNVRSIYGLKNYHPSLMELATKQLEIKVANKLLWQAHKRQFPDLYHLLLKFYGLY